MTTRHATKNDLDILVSLANSLWPEADSADLESELSQIIESDDAQIFLAEDDGMPVGFAQVQLRTDYVEGTHSSPVGYLEGIYVIPLYRGTKRGTYMLRACERWARDKGCTEFASDCELDNELGAVFHKALGFEEANRVVCYRKAL